MRNNPSFAVHDAGEIKRWIRENPWVTLVSTSASGELVASHYPVLLDDARDGIVLLSHVGRPDERLHELGRHEVLVVVQGPHGYISPGWYDDAPAVPTWNFSAAHLYGVPEILDDEENYRVLGSLVDAFESRMPQPRTMEDPTGYARRLLAGTVGFRLEVTRFVAKAKLSQNKPAEVVDRVIDALEGDGAYANADLAREMRRVRAS
ncbi:FMN-binding negative transcriptional regulator [Planctomonas psychrotolerans]|uniref:FMN-binding negative transcriptional regulator n=1 Tax=Planctomonas psychrotolerans TaxID=2528712 RepID=UPI0012394A8D|nr:FMN-binding negative transcriptional regulator [Planctomonas psychrotolerans]